MIDFEDISYLEKGNERQKAAYQVLLQHKILTHLADFQPILTGTIPINIDIPSSDLDVCCYWTDKEIFKQVVQDCFGHYLNFELKEQGLAREKTVMANFFVDGFEIEIFGQNIPTKQQNAYRHMVIEEEILEANGAEFRAAIIRLKLEGYKTEPAFAKVLKLEGDPYLAILNYL